ncbi:MAG: NAD-dependent epimerase/dehydratase family protein, partial [Planctomycetota bacterium]|nr:NAD-dependent epimerase/dehydratase family protein [Planctomycetota bacterium]
MEPLPSTTDPTFQGRTVCVTGGAGFIGSHLVEALLERGATVRVVDDLSSGRLEVLPPSNPGLSVFEGSILDSR